MNPRLFCRAHVIPGIAGDVSRETSLADLLAHPRPELAMASGRESASIPSKTLSPRAYKNRHSDREAAFNLSVQLPAESLIKRKGDSSDKTDLQQPHVHIVSEILPNPSP